MVLLIIGGFLVILLTSGVDLKNDYILEKNEY